MPTARGAHAGMPLKNVAESGAWMPKLLNAVVSGGSRNNCQAAKTHSPSDTQTAPENPSDFVVVSFAGSDMIDSMAWSGLRHSMTPVRNWWASSLIEGKRV